MNERFKLVRRTSISRIWRHLRYVLRNIHRYRWINGRWRKKLLSKSQGLIQFRCYWCGTNLKLDAPDIFFCSPACRKKEKKEWIASRSTRS
jgi:hypothetical protein